MTAKVNAISLLDAVDKELDFTSAEMIQFIKDKYAHGATDLEFAEFISICKLHGASPLKKEVYFVKYGDNGSVQFDYKFKIRKANETGVFKGFTEVLWYDNDDKEYVVWNKEKRGMPHAGRIGIYRTDWKEPRYVTLYWNERYKPQGEWKKQPLHMMEKSLISKAIDRFIPEVGTMFIIDELPNPDETEPVDPEQPVAEIADGARKKSHALHGNMNTEGDLMIMQDTKKKINTCFHDLGLKNKAAALDKMNDILKALEVDSVKGLAELTEENATALHTALLDEVKDGLNLEADQKETFFDGDDTSEGTARGEEK